MLSKPNKRAKKKPATNTAQIMTTKKKQPNPVKKLADWNFI
jgi:hypothetical protein